MLAGLDPACRALLLARKRHFGFCPVYPTGFHLPAGNGCWMELSNWIASCLLLKGLCIPLSINLFMAHG